MFFSTKKDILDLLRNFAEGKISLDQFQEQFEYLFLDREKWPILDPPEKEFFSDILERIGWVSENPTPEERELGWIDSVAFRQWVRGALRDFQASDPDHRSPQYPFRNGDSMRRVGHEIEKLEGRELRLACVEVLFANREQEGGLGDFGLIFSGDVALTLGCAGDGGIFVSTGQCGEKRPAPGMSLVVRPLSGVGGFLKSVQKKLGELELTFERGVLLVKNQDDELEVFLDGEPLERSIFRRVEE